MQKYGGQGEIVGKKFGLRKTYYAVPKKGFKKDTKPTITITKKEMDKLHTDKQIDKGNLKVLYKEGLLISGDPSLLNSYLQSHFLSVKEI